MATKRFAALGEQAREFILGGRAVDPADLVTLDDEHVAGHAGHGEPSHEVRFTVDIDMPHPRDISSPRYLELRDGILDAIGLAHKV